MTPAAALSPTPARGRRASWPSCFASDFSRPPSSCASSARPTTNRCWWWPAPARARPRRWRCGWSGWSPTRTCAPSRCSASPSPARRPASWPTGSGSTSAGPSALLGHDAPARRRADRRHLPLVRGPDRRRARAAGRVRADGAAAHRGGLLAARRRRPVRQYDSPAMRDVPARPGQRRPRPCWTSPASWPSTCATRTRSRPGPAGFTATMTNASGRRRSHAGAGRARPAGGPAARCCRWSGSTRRRKADLEAMDFGDQLRRAATVAREHRRGRRDRAGPVPGGAARRVPGHQSTPRWCCCGRCSAAATR